MKYLYRYLIIIVIVALSACRREEFYFTPPITYRTVGNIVVPSTTIFLNDTVLQSLQEATDDHLTFTQGPEILDQIRENDILIIGYSEKSPSGMIRRVSSIQEENSSLLIGTTSATLNEAIKEGTIHFTRELKRADFKLVSKKKSLKIPDGKKEFDGLAFFLNHFELLHDNEVLVQADGMITITPEIDVEITFNDFKVVKTKINITINKVDELTVSTNLAFNGQNQVDLATYEHSPIIMDGITFVPVVSFSIGIDGTSSDKAMIGVRQERDITTQMGFENETWTATFDHNKTTDYIEPQITANANFKVYSKQNIQLIICGILGPLYSVTSFSQLTADTNENNWWHLYIGMNSTVTCKADMLGLSQDYSQELEALYSELANSNGSYSGD